MIAEKPADKPSAKPVETGAAKRDSGTFSEFSETTTFNVRARLDSQVEADYWRHGGVLDYVLRRYLQEA